MSAKRSARGDTPESSSSPTRAMLPVDLAIFWPPIWRCAQWSQVWTNGLPVAASLCAISSSWWGQIRSSPPVGMASLEQQLDEPDDRADVLGGAWEDVRDGHSERLDVGHELLGVAIGQLADIDALPGRPPDDLVVDVGDVHHPGDAMILAAK